MNAKLALCLIPLAVAAISSPAHALDTPRTARSVQLGAGFRYGVSLDDPELDPWGTGLGVEIGYTMQNAAYVGAVFDYFFGESQMLFGTEFSANIWQLAGEVGYDLQLSEGVLLRPKVGAGVATLSYDCGGCGAEGTESKFAAAPGLTAMFFPGSILLSFDTRYQMVFAEEMVSALIFSFGIGF